MLIFYRKENNNNIHYKGKTIGDNNWRTACKNTCPDANILTKLLQSYAGTIVSFSLCQKRCCAIAAIKSLDNDSPFPDE